PLIKAGQIKVYASTGAERDALFPDVPTFAELGYKALSRPFWHALFAPAATPKPILERLNAALRTALDDPKVKAAYAAAGLEAYPQAERSTEAANRFVQGEMAFWTTVVRENHIKIE